MSHACVTSRVAGVGQDCYGTSPRSPSLCIKRRRATWDMIKGRRYGSAIKSCASFDGQHRSPSVPDAARDAGTVPLSSPRRMGVVQLVTRR